MACEKIYFYFLSLDTKKVANLCYRIIVFCELKGFLTYRKIKSPLFTEIIFIKLKYKTSNYMLEKLLFIFRVNTLYSVQYIL